MKPRTIGIALAISALAASASAHHSYGMFDRSKEVKLSGVVKGFDWTNPHAHIQVMVDDPKGEPQTWEIEMGPPGQLARTGWKRTSLKLGDKVNLLIYAVRDGKPAGHLLMVTTPEGQDLYDVVFKHPPETPGASAPGG